MSGIRFLVTLEPTSDPSFDSQVYSTQLHMYVVTCSTAATDRLQLPYDSSLLQVQANGISDNIAVG